MEVDPDGNGWWRRRRSRRKRVALLCIFFYFKILRWVERVLIINHGYELGERTDGFCQLSTCEYRKRPHFSSNFIFQINVIFCLTIIGLGLTQNKSLFLMSSSI